MDEETERDITEVIYVYRQVKYMVDELVNFFKLLLSFSVIGLWIYVVWTILLDAFIKLHILSDLPLLLVIFAIWTGGMVFILVKLKEFRFI